MQENLEFWHDDKQINNSGCGSAVMVVDKPVRYGPCAEDSCFIIEVWKNIWQHGYCLYECDNLDGDVIAIVENDQNDQLIDTLYLMGYTVYTVAEEIEVSEMDIPMIRQIHMIKKQALQRGIGCINIISSEKKKETE